MNDINSAISAAQQAAAQIVDAAPPAVYTPQTTAAAVYTKPSMDSMGNTGGIVASVDNWLKVQAEGLKVDDLKGLVDDMEVRILMIEDDGFFVKQSIKWGNPVAYASTYDGVASDRGGAWSDQVAKVQSIDPKAKPFPSADIIMTLTKDVKFKDAVVKAGTKLGHTLSMSNWRGWSEFYREVGKANLMGQEVDVKISAQSVDGKNGYTWGVVQFGAPTVAA